MEAVAAERQARGPFRSLHDFLRRSDVAPADVRLLIKAGAFDGVSGGSARPALMWEWVRWNAARDRGGHPLRSRQGNLFAAPDAKGVAGLGSAAGPGSYGAGEVPFSVVAERAGAPPVTDLDPMTVLRHEAETLGFLVSRHPLALYRNEMAGLRHVAGADLHKHVGRTVTTIGWLVTGKLVSTKDDEPMEFVSFEDTTALYETTLFPETYARFCHMLSHRRPYVLRGKVEEDFGAITLTVNDVRFLDRPQSNGLHPQIRGPSARINET
jgi:error-prone DNA polymerase